VLQLTIQPGLVMENPCRESDWSFRLQEKWQIRRLRLAGDVDSVGPLALHEAAAKIRDLVARLDFYFAG
jgi:hypothetical protein